VSLHLYLQFYYTHTHNFIHQKLRFCIAVTLFKVRSTRYGVRGPHHFGGAPVAQQPLPSLVLKLLLQLTIVQTVNSLYYQQLVLPTVQSVINRTSCSISNSSALFRKIWCIYLHPVRTYWIFFISHNLKIQDGGSRHLVFWRCEFDHFGV